MNYSRHFLLTRFLGVFLFSIFYFLFSQPAEAATFMVGSPQSEARVGEEVMMNIGVDTEGARLNLFNVKMKLPDEVEFMSLDNEKSIVSVWVQEPAFDPSTREVSLIGGVPGGAMGRVVLTTLRVIPRRAGAYQFTVAPEAEAYLNDGLGTKAEVSVAPWTLEVQGRPRSLLVYIIVLAAIVLAVGWYLWHRDHNAKKTQRLTKSASAKQTRNFTRN